MQPFFFQNQSTDSPVHSVIKTVEFNRDHRVQSDGRGIVYSVRNVFIRAREDWNKLKLVI